MAMALLTADAMVYTILVSRNFYITNGGRRGESWYSKRGWQTRERIDPKDSKRVNRTQGRQKSVWCASRANEWMVC